MCRGLSSDATSGVAVRPKPVRWGIVTILFAGLIGSAHAQFSMAVGGGSVDIGAAVTTDAQGNIYLAGSTTSLDFPVTAGALQTKPAGGSDAFIAKYSPAGRPIWATYFGGSGDDAAVAIAVGADGSVVVTGKTLSHDLPTVNAFQPSKAGGYDVFLLKLDSTGSHILYSTYLGGTGDDLPTALALDSVGSAFVTGSEVSPSFPGTTSTTFGAFVTKVDATGALVWTYLRPKGTTAGIAVDAAGNSYIAGTLTTQSMATGSAAIDVVGSSQALVFKLAADGSHEIYTKTFGGNLSNKGTAIAVDALGAAYVAGTTWSADFPLVHSLQNSLDARPIWRSLDHGATWSPLDGLPFANPQTLVIDPTAPSTLYIAAIDGGVFKSADGGASWKSASAGIDGSRVQALAIDPSNPQALYAGTGSYAVAASGAIYKSTDGAATWSRVDAGNNAITQLSVDPLHPANVYAITNFGPMRKTSDGGATWSTASFPLRPCRPSRWIRKSRGRYTPIPRSSYWDPEWTFWPRSFEVQMARRAGRQFPQPHPRLLE